jgi:hypothetical protein
VVAAGGTRSIGLTAYSIQMVKLSSDRRAESFQFLLHLDQQTGRSRNVAAAEIVRTNHRILFDRDDEVLNECLAAQLPLDDRLKVNLC